MKPSGSSLRECVTEQVVQLCLTFDEVNQKREQIESWEYVCKATRREEIEAADQEASIKAMIEYAQRTHGWADIVRRHEAVSIERKEYYSEKPTKKRKTWAEEQEERIQKHKDGVKADKAQTNRRLLDKTWNGSEFERHEKFEKFSERAEKAETTEEEDASEAAV